VPLNFGELVDATNSARRETPVDVVDANGNHFTVEQVQVDVDPEGAVTSVRMMVAPAV
jgi:hypothetical protein